MTDRARYTARQKAGVLLFDLPRLLARLCGAGDWTKVWNRRDKIEVSAVGRGVDCKHEWSNDIHACAVFPILGRLLMRRALDEWPIELSTRFRSSRSPRVSFVIPHRGVERLPLLRLTLSSLLGQTDASVECIVVEQSSTSDASDLPDGVRYLHLPHPVDRESWRKSWAINEGVGAATADVVVLHDGDIIAPRGYAVEILRTMEMGYDAAFLGRFLFCLAQADTGRISLGDPTALRSSAPEHVRQNWKGGTVAISKAAFARVGGFDERFVGWTGEDREFHDRCATLRTWEWGYLPFVHLWHPAQPTKQGVGRLENLAFFRAVLAEPRELRIQRLVSLRR